jgi:hypothetical protein
MPAPVLDTWRQDKDAVRNENLDLSVRRLQAQASSRLVEADSAILDAQARYTAAVRSSADTPNFDEIVERSLAVRQAELARAEAQRVFASLFGETAAG